MALSSYYASLQASCVPPGTAPLFTACQFNHNSQMLIAAGSDSKVRIFDLRKRDCISSWSTEGGEEASPVVSLALSPDETAIYTLTSDGKFAAWSLYQAGRCRMSETIPDNYFESNYPRKAYGRLFALAGNGRHVLVCSTAGGVIYEIGDGGMQKVLGMKGHAAHATCTDWSVANDCGPCITAAADGNVRVSTLLSQ